MDQKKKGSGKYTQAFFISVAINIGLVSSLVYLANKKSLSIEHDGRSQTKKIEKPKFAELNAAEVLSEFFEKNYDDLFRFLADDTLIEDGYKKRDFALGCLVTFHHLDIQKALKGQVLQEREIAFTHTDGGETVRVKVYPGLCDEQFDVIDHFAKVEAWPLTSEGLFFALLRAKSAQQWPLGLKETFYLSKEFNTIYKLLSTKGAVDLEEVLALILDGDWALLEKTNLTYKASYDNSFERLREFLLQLLDKGSKIAANYLLVYDFDFVTKKLDDGLIAKLLELSEATELGVELAKAVYVSYRSSYVIKLSEQRLKRCRDIDLSSLKEIKQETQTVTNIEIKEESNPGSYIVSKGDSLWKIAKRFKTTVKELQRVNNISKNSYIKPGMKLNLP